jgi:hypothetical protein
VAPPSRGRSRTPHSILEQLATTVKRGRRTVGIGREFRTEVKAGAYAIGTAHLLLANCTPGPPRSARSPTSAASEPNEILGLRQGMAREAAEGPQPADGEIPRLPGIFLGRGSALNRRPHRRRRCAPPRHRNPRSCRAFRLDRPSPSNRSRPPRGLKAPGARARKNPAFTGLLSGRPDLNRGPHRPERCALPGCATPRWAQYPTAAEGTCSRKGAAAAAQGAAAVSRAG